MNTALSWFGPLAALALAPLLPGIINRVKARMAGRRGKPILQLYYDINKLLRKSPVIPRVTGPVFTAAPALNLGTVVVGLFLVPLGGFAAPLAFEGDFLAVAAALALGRFAMILAALDTGSAFEGMGAAREALFGAMAEPIFLLGMAVLAYKSGGLSLSEMLPNTSPDMLALQRPFFLLLGLALFLLLLTENSRIPVDDPNTHLELTMIHEVMVLDHSGPDLALVEYAAALKLWLFSLLVAGVLLPAHPPAPAGAGTWETLAPVLSNLGSGLAAVAGTAVVVGLVESFMARLRMERVPQVLTLAGAFACLAGIVLWR